MSEYVEYDFHPLSLPAELTSAIGRVIASSAHTESLVEQAIAGLAGLDGEYMMAVTTHMTAQQRISVLRSTAEIRLRAKPELLAELEALIRNVEAVMSLRNAVAHDGWCRHPVTGEVHRVSVTARRRVKAELRPFAVSDLEGVATRVYDAGIALYGFILRHRLIPRLPGGLDPYPRA